MASKNHRKTILYFIRLVVCVALVAFVLLRYDSESILLRLKNVNPGYLLLAWALNYAGVFLSTVKWHSILKSYGERPSLANLWALYVEGMFFNLLFPGFIAGDVSRAVRASANNSLSTRAVMAVFLERFSGLFTFCILIGLVALSGGYQGLAAPWYLLIAGLFVLGLLALISLLRLDFITRLARYVPGPFRTRIETGAGKLAAAARILTTHKELLWRLPLFSLLFFLLSGPVAYFSAKSVGVAIPLPIWMVYAPFIAFLSNLPVSIAGVGVRENLAVHFYANMGYRPEDIVAYALAQSAVLFLVNLSGGIILLVRSTKVFSPALRPQSYEHDLPEN